MKAKKLFWEQMILPQRSILNTAVNLNRKFPHYGIFYKSSYENQYKYNPVRFSGGASIGNPYTPPPPPPASPLGGLGTRNPRKQSS